MAHGWTLRKVAFGLPDTRSTSSMFGFFKPLAPSYQHQSVDQIYANHERQNMLAYGERVRRVEHGTLTPLVFTCTGGAGWHRRSPTLGTCPTVKRWDGYAAECLSLFSATQSFPCLEASGRNRVCLSIKRAIAATQAWINELG